VVVVCFSVLSRFSPRRSEEFHEKPVTVVSVMAEIWTGRLPKLHPFSRFARWQNSNRASRLHVQFRKSIYDLRYVKKLFRNIVSLCIQTWTLNLKTGVTRFSPWLPCYSNFVSRYSLYLRYILLLQIRHLRLCLPGDLLPSGSPAKTVSAFLISPCELHTPPILSYLISSSK
jgi:hypothetical protein